MFVFRRFSVEHERSSMKVGTDGILLGAWAEMPSVPDARVLDAGCGCGLIALMAAQRTDARRATRHRATLRCAARCRATQRQAALRCAALRCAALPEILAIDIDGPSVEEAARNFAASPWSGRLRARRQDFRTWASPSDGCPSNQNFHLIISNPPFFSGSLKCPDPARRAARHTDTLSFRDLISVSERLLCKDGSLALILPPSAFVQISEMCPEAAPSLHLQRLTKVYAKEGKPCVRVLAQWRKGAVEAVDERSLYIRDRNGGYTPAYLELVREFYLPQGLS